MSLSEPQIIRYSRQILLREVGGKGQSALIASPVRVEGRGAALSTAAAYAAAGGSPTDASTLQRASGFPLPPEVAAAPVTLMSDTPEQTDQHQILIAGDVLVVAPRGTCSACLAANDSDDHESEAPDLVGSLASLAHQRLVLGLETALRVTRVDATGLIEELAAKRCEAHR